MTIGTPPQKFRFHLDTGSSDLWTNSATSSLCTSGSQGQGQGQSPDSDGIPCSVSGTYSANDSSSYKYINSDFKISYADNTGASGDYVSDTLNIGQATLTNLQMGVGYQSTSTEGVMGIGYPGLEVAVQNNEEQSYKNIPQLMVSQGLINSPAYSLWLDDIQSATGNILFGGVDTVKYAGSLEKLPIVKENGDFLEMIVALSGLTLVNGNSNTTISSEAIPVLLDSGSTLSYLPQDTAEALYQAVGAQYSSREGLAFCPCSLASSDMKLDFLFSNKVISVSMSEMVLEGSIGSQSSSTGCTFGIVVEPSGQGSTFTLGDTFIRNAYVVYDLENNEISLAQTNFAATTSDVQEIGTGPDSVPDASGVASAVDVAVTGTATRVLGGPNASPTSAASSTLGSSALMIWFVWLVAGIVCMVAN